MTTGLYLQTCHKQTSTKEWEASSAAELISWLHNVDDRQIPVMTSSRTEISNTFVFAGLCHKIIQNDQISLRYVQVSGLSISSRMPSLNSVPGIVLIISK